MAYCFLSLAILTCLSQLSTSRSFIPQPSLYLSTTVTHILRQQISQQLLSVLLFGAPFTTYRCPSSPSTTYISFGSAKAPIKILLVCGVHARELITVDTCLEYLRQFGGNARLKRNVRLDVFLSGNSERPKVLKGGYDIRKNANSK
jgi:hypothetical protein